MGTDLLDCGDIVTDVSLEKRRAAWRAIQRLGAAGNSQAIANMCAEKPTEYQFIGFDLGRDVSEGNRKT